MALEIPVLAPFFADWACLVQVLFGRQSRLSKRTFSSQAADNIPLIGLSNTDPPSVLSQLFSRASLWP